MEEQLIRIRRINKLYKDAYATNKYEIEKYFNIRIDVPKDVDERYVLRLISGLLEKYNQLNFSAYAYFEYMNLYQDIQPVGHGNVGLVNLGNLCYMNATLQCLAHTPGFSRYIIEKEYKNEKLQPYVETVKIEHLDAFSDLLTSMWKTKSGQVVNETIIQNFVDAFENLTQMDVGAGKIGHRTQEDASQFIIKFSEYLTLPNVYEEIDYDDPVAQVVVPAATPEERATPQYEAWEEKLKTDDSFILKYFGGQLCQLKIYKCDKHNIDPKIDCNDTRTFFIQNVDPKLQTIYQSLDSYFKDSRPTYKCEECGEVRETGLDIELAFYKLPKNLVIFINRYAHEGGEHGGRKDSSYFEIPNVLNLNQYSTNIITTEIPNSNECKYVLEDLEYEYTLYGIVRHSGALGGGHYFAYCRDMWSGEWWEYNDDSARKMKGVPADDDGVRRNALLLFYTKKLQS